MSVKIFVGYHKPSKFLVKSDLFVPLQLGRKIVNQPSKDGALNKKDILWMEKNTIGDDSGDNISELNRFYCELTGIYWIYKNYEHIGNPDYIGFMHYRRLFDFDGTLEKIPLLKPMQEELLAPENISLKTQISLLDLYLKHYTPELIEAIIKKYKVIRTYPIEETTFLRSKREKHKFEFDYVKKHYPDIFDNLQKQIKNGTVSYKNMFVMQRDDFFAYAKFMFEILQLNKDDIEPREKGYLAEILTSAYLEYLSNLHNSYLGCRFFSLYYKVPFLKLKLLVCQLGIALSFGETKQRFKKKKGILKTK